MPNLSVITLAGHVGREPNLKDVNGTPVLEFSVAVNDRNQNADWYRCAIWGSRGEKLAPHIGKGSAVIVTGQLTPRTYTGKEGQERMSLDVRVDQFAFAGPPPDKQAKPKQDQVGWSGLAGPASDDDSIPF